MIRAVLLAPFFLGACAMTQDGARLPGDTTAEVPMDEAGGFACEAEAAAKLIGQRPSEELGQRAIDLSGARSLRWIGPGMMVTMDFREDRLNIRYNEDYRVTKIDCG